MWWRKKPNDWKLYAGEELIADLVVTGLDDPWFHARVEPHPGLERFRPLFEEELKGEDGDLGDPEFSALRRELRLFKPGGERVSAFMLHVDGEVAWWRWVD
jgi:hypothetical protein